jgi:hypothetical protein
VIGVRSTTSSDRASCRKLPFSAAFAHSLLFAFRCQPMSLAMTLNARSPKSSTPIADRHLESLLGIIKAYGSRVE